MFDSHSHILPAIDDGSRNVEESLRMIDELKRQGVSCIAATPHFYSMNSSPESFFLERRASWENLKGLLKPDAPEIRLGAEVQYFEGMDRYAELERFCIAGTKLLLIEMPSGVWTSRMVSTILNVNDRPNVTAVIAHFERYLSRHNRNAFEKCIERGVLIQASTRFFIEKKHSALRYLRDGKIHLLGTDAHNMKNRSPDMASALKIIKSAKGADLLCEIEQREAKLLDERAEETLQTAENSVLENE